MTSPSWKTKGTDNGNRQNQEWRSNNEQSKEQMNMLQMNIGWSLNDEKQKDQRNKLQRESRIAS